MSLADVADRIPLPPPRPVCTVEECGDPVASKGLCSKHYFRMRRTGRTDLRPPSELKRRGGGGRGYRRVYKPDHPLASPETGIVREHRLVLYAVLGPGEHPCHWCRIPVAWENGDLVVDHLDWDRQNNTPANLVASCSPCNLNRTKREN